MRITAASALVPSVVLFFLLSQVIHGKDVERELEGVKRRIKREEQGITKVRKEEGSVLQALEGIEKKLNSKNKRLKSINSRLESILVDLQKKERQVRSVGFSLRGRRKLLRERARALYKWQRGGSPFILFNGGGSITDLMRRKRYLELMLAKDRGLLEDLLRKSARQEALKRELAVKRGDLDRERRVLVKVKESIRREREKKRKILVRLQREREIRGHALRELEEAANRLQKLMDEFNRKSMVKPVEVYPRKGFRALRGKLRYPVQGKVVRGFGKTRHPEFPAELFRKGINIEAPLGEEIKAVESGRVIFAGWVSGYGEMIIIDHGERYYTVYAHLSDLLKKPGGTVLRGETIALVGDRSSLRGSRLYFEIRKDGKPLDPLPWFGK